MHGQMQIKFSCVNFYRLWNAHRPTRFLECTCIYSLHVCVCVCGRASVHTCHFQTPKFNHRWAPTSPWQISTCVWDQCCCTCGSSPWSHSLCTITHHLRPCLNHWLTDGRISPDKKSLSDWSPRLTWAPEGPGLPSAAGPKRVHLCWVCPPDTLGQIPQYMDLCSHHHCYVYVCNLPITAS